MLWFRRVKLTARGLLTAFFIFLWLKHHLIPKKAKIEKRYPFFVYSLVFWRRVGPRLVCTSLAGPHRLKSWAALTPHSLDYSARLDRTSYTTDVDTPKAKQFFTGFKMASLWMNSWNKYKISTLAEIPRANPAPQLNQRYKMTVIKWPFGCGLRRILKHEFHVLEHHRSLQEPDVLWRFKNRTGWYSKKWT